LGIEVSVDTSPVRRRDPDGKWLALAALGTYTCVSSLFFGPPVFGHFSSMYVGGGIDPPLAMWALVWWPYALRHGLNPFFTDRVWAPHGASLAWLTGVPGASLLAAPVTQAAGPVATYNVLSLLAPALAAWTAYILCRHLTKQFWPSMFAGYVFGFSPYELGHVQGHLNLMFICLIPLAVYLVLLRLDRAITPRAFVLFLGAVLFLQFLFSNEIFATLSVFGAVAFGLAYRLLPAGLKPDLRSAGVHILYAYGVAGAALSPYLYAILTQGILRHPLADVEVYSTDLLNFFVPTPFTLIGGAALEPIARAFSGNSTEASAYVGLPLLLVIALFARSHWRRPEGRLLLCVLGIVAVASLGPTLHIAGQSTVPLPWRLAMLLPVIKVALPARFAVYTALIVAIIVAFWLSAAAHARTRWALVCLAAIFLLPDLWRPSWAAPAATPAFFSDKLYRRYLREGETVLIIPYGANGNGTLWQAEAGMHFRMAEGVGTGSIPRDFFQWPINYTFYSGRLIPDYAGQLKAYLAAHAIRTIIVADGTPGPWAQLFTTLGGEPLRRGGVTLYPVPERLHATRPLTLLEIEGRSNLALAASLIATANYYLSRGIPLSELTPLDAEQRDLLPKYWGGYVASQGTAGQRLEFSTRTGLWLGPWDAGTISVGLTASGQTIGPLIARYGTVAQRVYFPYPQPLTAGPARGEGVLLLMFTHDGIRRAAAMPEATMPP
jgi:hypothetical protein